MIPLAFGCVYIFWGSSYTAIRYAVHFIEPMYVSGVRYAIGATMMMLLLLVRGTSLRITRREALRVTVIGLLLLTCNNGLLGIGEQYISSGMASLIMAGIPILIAILETLIPGGEPLNRIGWTGTVLGAAGLALLLWPSLHLPAGSDGGFALGCGILLIAMVSWAVGSIVSRRWTTRTDPLVVSAWQMLVGGIANCTIGTAMGGLHHSHWTTSVFLSILYLATFGSLIGYTAYTYLLHHVPVAKVATYAYVNPIVAVGLGAVLLGERLRQLEVVGMAIILAAVAMVTASKSAVQKDLTTES
jgi:drug/metabolite transporter (DMT)-like permease